MRQLTAPALLLGCLFVGLPIGGLRDPLLWTAVAALIWLVALASPPPTAPTLRPWAWWLAWALLSLLACDQPLKGLYAFARWLTLVAFFHVAGEHWSDRDSRRWLAGLAACALIVGLGALLIKGVVHPMTGLLPPYYNYTVFVEAAFFAAAMGALGHRDGPRGGARWALGGLMAFALALIVLARSRSGLLAVAAAFAVWLWRRGQARRLAAGGLALAAAALALPQAADYLLKVDLAAWFTRPQIWTAALRVAAEHPFLGEGLGNFEQGFLRHNFPKSWATNYGFSADHAHSEPLEMVATTGWVGLALFLAALIKSVRPAGPRTASPWAEAGLCAFAAMAAQCLIDNMLHMPALAMLLLTAMLCLRAASEPGALPRAAVLGARPWRALCAAGMLLSTVAFFPQWLANRAWSLHAEEPDPAKRAALIGGAVRLFPADYYLREAWARSWLDLRPPRPDRAYEELTRAARLNPGNALYPIMQAELELARGRRAQALRLVNRAVALEPNYLAARMLRAELWAAAGRKKAARRELDEILRRRERLKDLPPYSAYDRAIIGFDAKRFAAARSF